MAGVSYRGRVWLSGLTNRPAQPADNQRINENSLVQMHQGVLCNWLINRAVGGTAEL